MAVVATNLPREAQAFLDAISEGESGGADRYNELYGGDSMVGLPNRAGHYGFPEWPGKDNSHAAGRYQFEPATWLGIVPKFSPGSPDFRNPADQDWGAWFLAQQDFKVRTGKTLLSELQADSVDGIGSALHATWTSLSDETFPGRYHSALDALPQEEPSQPAPTPAPPQVPTPSPSPSPTPSSSVGSPTSAHPAVTVSASAGLGGAVVGILINHGILSAADAPYAITIMGAISGWLMYQFTWLRVPT